MMTGGCQCGAVRYELLTLELQHEVHDSGG
jgi:hypothetical protein